MFRHPGTKHVGAVIFAVNLNSLNTFPGGYVDCRNRHNMDNIKQINK